MADACMAMDARKHISTLVAGEHVVDQLPVAMEASFLNNPAVSFFDLNRIFEGACGKRNRMEETVVSLGQVLANHTVVGRVTIITHGDGMVTGLLPRVVTILHHVTVGAGNRIVTEVSVPFAVAKGEDARTGKHSAGRCHGKRRQPRRRRC
jgi:hypothetical protein